jgi:hypothetical protein
MAKNHQRLACLVHLANIICVTFGIGVGNEGLAYALHPSALETVGVEMTDLQKYSIEIHEQFHRAEELVGLTYC